MNKENSSRKIRIEKVTLNIGAGKSQDRLDKGVKLLKELTGVSPVKTVTKKRIPAWGLRPGLPIGAKLTLRKTKAREIVKRMLEAVDLELKDGQFDSEGNVAFGVHEYIDIPGIKYMPDIGIMGLQCCVTLERAGFRIKKRKRAPSSIPKRHRIEKQEAIEFMKNEFGVRLKEEAI